jgi:hypothetical protein
VLNPPDVADSSIREDTEAESFGSDFCSVRFSDGWNAGSVAAVGCSTPAYAAAGVPMIAASESAIKMAVTTRGIG